MSEQTTSMRNDAVRRLGHLLIQRVEAGEIDRSVAESAQVLLTTCDTVDKIEALIGLVELIPSLPKQEGGAS